MPATDLPPDREHDPRNRFSLRSGIALLRRGLPSRATVLPDMLAGLTGAIGSVPDGMASGVLVGVNPLYGLYASMVGPLVGGLFASTELMVITTTSASAIASGQALAVIPSAARAEKLFVLALVIGLFQIVCGLLRLGRFTRFVSHSVMTGFLTGIAALIILGQLGDFTGFTPSGPNKVFQALDLLLHLNQVNLESVVIGMLTVGLAILLPYTPLRAGGTLVALIIPSGLVALLHWTSVTLVKSFGPVPRGIPFPAVPRLSLLSFNVVTAALAIAAIILVQGAGVSQNAPNPDGTHASASRDFTAQGIANVASSLFQGLPVGGSLGQTALNTSSGARTRWAAIMSGLWMGIILLLFPTLVGYVAIPALAGLLILVAIHTINLTESLSIWRTSWTSRIAILTTFAATLFLPIQAAVGIGVALTAILYLNEAATTVTLREFVRLPDGRIEEREAPSSLSSDQIVVLEVYGSLFYAGARMLGHLLPSPIDASRPVVILRLRGRASVGSTLIDVLANYAEELRLASGRLYLSGVSTGVSAQLARTGKLDLHEETNIYEATGVLGESTGQAYAGATTWLLNKRHAASPSSETAP
jgi:sulfate permease, SulP family